MSALCILQPSIICHIWYCYGFHWEEQEFSLIKKDQRVQKLKISDGQMGTFTLLFCSLKNIKYGAEKFLTQLRSLSKQNVKILASTLHIFKWLHFYFVQICIYYTFVCVYEIDWLSQPNKYIHTSGKGKTYGYCNTKFIQTWN